MEFENSLASHGVNDPLFAFVNDPIAFTNVVDLLEDEYCLLVVTE
jgi:hypothetical protein